MTRNCYNAKTGRGAMFHGFFQFSDGSESGPLAIVEYPSGTVTSWNAEDTVFSPDMDADSTIRKDCLNYGTCVHTHNPCKDCESLHVTNPDGARKDEDGKSLQPTTNKGM